jgi:hypothetical protein
MKVSACAWLALAFVACAPEDILLGTRLTPDAGAPAPTQTSTAIPPEMMMPDASDAERSCRFSSDCEGTEFCSKEVCGGIGRCELLPAVCDNDRKPVCGCDGITYWNDCLRQSNSITGSTSGACDSTRARSCGGPQKATCPNEAHYCAKRLRESSQCMPDPFGVCWAVPSDCGDQADESNRWRRCGAPEDECLDACNVIKSEQPYFQSGRCPD